MGSEKNLRRCAVAPKYHRYEYCLRCGKGDPNKTFMFTFCSENCRDIFKVCDDFTHNVITGLEAKCELQKLDITDVEHFHPVFQQNIADILMTPEEKPKKMTKRKKSIVNEEN